jgi:Kef-type K+ transport system membrane component KefB
MVSAVIRLSLLLALLATIAWLQRVRGEEGAPVALAAGALLLSGLFAGKVAKQIGLPRLTGYLLIGIVVGPHVLRFIPASGVAGLNTIKGLAVSLIALAAGVELRLGLIRRVGRKVLVTGAAVCGVVFVVSWAAMIAIRSQLPFMAGWSWFQIIAVSALTATVIVSFSPTVTLAIVQETRARGTFTEFLMALVIIGDLVGMVLFALCAGVSHASFGAELNWIGLALKVVWELFGSLVVGAGMGLLTLIYLRKVGREVPVFLCAVCFVSAETGTHLHLSPLMLALSAGAVIANLDEREGERLHHAIQRAGLPVFALFFAAAGAGLQLEVLGTVGPVALVLVAVRAVSIYFSTRRFAPRDDPRLKPYLWMGLISQAGVTFGLAALVRRSFPTFGPQVEVLIVAMITVHELVGPILTRKSLEKAGEVQVEEAVAK